MKKVPVKVSNGEHVFTPQERAILEAQGVDLSLLAPNAKNGFSLKNGGEVPKGYTKGGDVTGTEPKSQEELDKLVRSLPKANQQRLQADLIKNGFLKEADAKGGWGKKSAAAYKAMMDDIHAADALSRLPSESKEGPAQINNQGLISKVGGAKVNVNGTDISPALKTGKEIIEPVATQYNSTNGLINITPGTTMAVSPGTKVNEVGTPVPDNKMTFNPEGVDLGLLASIGQIGGGLATTLGSKRPIDTIDPAYADAVAKAQVKTGLSPEEFQANANDIEYNRRSGIDTAVDASGGNTGVAMGNARAATQQANEGMLKLTALDASLKRQNQQYATGLLADLDRRKRQIFEDSNNAFKENQGAGMELLGSGIDNLIQRQRTKRMEKFLPELAKAGKVDYSTYNG